jgi:hypothetical protein
MIVTPHALTVVTEGEDRVLVAERPLGGGRSQSNRARRSSSRVTWRTLVRIEPALAALETEIRALRPAPGERFCANGCWYGFRGHRGIKPRLERLVGWDAVDPRLATCQAYDLAYDHLYRLLPDCRGCACL